MITKDCDLDHSVLIITINIIIIKETDEPNKYIYIVLRGSFVHL